MCISGEENNYGKKVKRPSKHQKKKDLKKIKAELKNSGFVVLMALLASAGLLFYWLNHKESHPVKIGLLIACVALSTGFSKFYATYIKYQQGQKELAAGKMVKPVKK